MPGTPNKLNFIIQIFSLFACSLFIFPLYLSGIRVNLPPLHYPFEDLNNVNILPKHNPFFILTSNYKKKPSNENQCRCIKFSYFNFQNFGKKIAAYEFFSFSFCQLTFTLFFPLKLRQLTAEVRKRSLHYKHTNRQTKLYLNTDKVTKWIRHTKKMKIYTQEASNKHACSLIDILMVKLKHKPYYLNVTTCNILLSFVPILLTSIARLHRSGPRTRSRVPRM